MSEKEGIISMTLQEVLDSGVRCYQNRDVKGAIFYFEHYVQYVSDNDEVLHLLVQLKCEVNDYSQALRLSEKLVKYKPENDEYKFTFAKALFFNNSFAKAEKILLFLKGKFPLSSDVLDFLERIYTKQGDKLSAKRIVNLKDKVEKEIDPVKKEISKTVTLASTMIEEDK
ncbi:MAG: CDC27 family protein, partial [Oceanisphaera sp.]|uniref:tetratricopeptide repeat protein n=1 Tax=Oceanisphaera sp. TaxID=1929979 RepID=UPI003C7639D5